MKTTVYVHADSDMMAQLGEGLGLNENARGQFRHALGEIKVDLDVNEETGVGTILRVDDRDVAHVEDVYPANTIKPETGRLSNKIGIVMGGYLNEAGRLMDRTELHRRISDLQDFEKKATVEIVVLRTHILNAIGALKSYDAADVLDMTVDNLTESLEQAILTPLKGKQVLDPEPILTFIRHKIRDSSSEQEPSLVRLKELITEGQFNL